MHFGSSPSASSRWTSLALVALLHLLMVYAISTGLIHRAVQTLNPPPQVKMVDEALKPPPELPKLPLRDVVIERPDIVRVPTPTVPPIDNPLPPIQVVAHDVFPPVTDGPAKAGTGTPGPGVNVVPEAAKAQPVSAGMLCPVMAKPELPASALEGMAQLRVQGTVRGGRVVAVEVQTLQALPDRRAQRQLVSSVENTLRSGYQCSNDGVFSQEFVFRVE